MAAQPDPFAAGSTVEFIRALRLLKVWAGNPSFSELARRSGLPQSTLSDVVKPNRRRMARLEVVSAFVRACGAEPATVSKWEDAWRHVQSDDLGHHVVGPPIDLVPRELPPDIIGFSGRTEALEALDGLSTNDAAPKNVLICGTAGVGKTALAVRWCTRMPPAFLTARCT